MPADASGLRFALGTYANDVFEKASQDFLDTIEVQAPVKSGELQKSGRLTPKVVVNRRFTRDLVFDAPQALWTDEGTKPHRIRPRNSSVLVFFWPSGPRGADTYFFLGVDHPGTAAQRWFSGNVTDAAWADAVDGAT